VVKHSYQWAIVPAGGIHFLSVAPVVAKKLTDMLGTWVRRKPDDLVA
jgi:hypothetical protein